MKNLTIGSLLVTITISSYAQTLQHEESSKIRAAKTYIECKKNIDISCMKQIAGDNMMNNTVRVIEDCKQRPSLKTRQINGMVSSFRQGIKYDKTLTKEDIKILRKNLSKGLRGQGITPTNALTNIASKHENYFSKEVLDLFEILEDKNTVGKTKKEIIALWEKKTFTDEKFCEKTTIGRVFTITMPNQYRTEIVDNYRDENGKELANEKDIIRYIKVPIFNDSRDLNTSEIAKLKVNIIRVKQLPNGKWQGFYGLE